MEDIRDLKFNYLQEKASQDRMDVVRSISFKKKLEIAIDLSLIEESYLEDRIYESKRTYDELLDEVYG